MGKGNGKRIGIPTWRRDLKTGAIIALAKYFNVSADYLLGLSDYKTAQTSDIGAMTGLTEKSIEALNVQVKFFQALKNTLEEEVSSSENLTSDEADFSLDAAIGLEARHNEILNNFVLGLVNKNDLIAILGECRFLYDAMYKVAEFLESGQGGDCDEEIRMYLFTQMIGADMCYKHCSNKITNLINDTVHYDPSKIEKISKQLVDAVPQKMEWYSEEFEKRVLKAMIKHKEGEINGND